MDIKINKIKERYRGEINTIEAEMAEQFDTLEHYAKTNETLFEKKKSIPMLHGKIGFRTGTPKLKTRRGFTWAAALELTLKQLPDFIRVKQDVDREQIIANREADGMADKIHDCGMEVVQDETFFVEPSEESVPA